MDGHPKYLLDHPTDSALDLRRLEEISTPHVSEFLQVFRRMYDQLSSPSTFYNLLSFFETIALEQYSYLHLQTPHGYQIFERELLRIFQNHGIAVEFSVSGTSRVYATLSPKGRNFFDQVYRVLKIQWVSRYARKAGTFIVSSFSVHHKSSDVAAWEADVTFADHLVCLMLAEPNSTPTHSQDLHDGHMVRYADDHARRYAKALLDQLATGNDTDSNDQDPN